MKRITIIGILGVIFTTLPTFLMAQSVGNEINKFHGVLQGLLNEMIPLSDKLLGASRAIAGFAAIWYIGVRVWKHLAAAEPIDFFPLFRPFVITLLILNYSIVLDVMQGILYPTVAATDEMVKNSNDAVSVLLQKRGEAIVKNEEWQTLSGGLDEGKEDWRKYEEQEDSGDGGSLLGKAISYSISLYTNSIMYICKFLLSIILQVLYFAASLTIDTLRTFQLLILSLLGPFVLAISVFDGFQQSLVSWIGRYINVYLWLPIANLFGALIGKIQQGMIQIDLSDIADQGIISFGQTSVAYLIFLIIGIVGYLRIPAIANYVIQTSGGSQMGSKLASAAKMMITKSA